MKCQGFGCKTPAAVVVRGYAYCDDCAESLGCIPAAEWIRISTLAFVRDMQEEIETERRVAELADKHYTEQQQENGRLKLQIGTMSAEAGITRQLYLRTVSERDTLRARIAALEAERDSVRAEAERKDEQMAAVKAQLRAACLEIGEGDKASAEVERLRRFIDDRMIKLPPFRYLKDRSISDETYSEYSHGWDDAILLVTERLRDARIPYATTRATAADFEE